MTVAEIQSRDDLPEELSGFFRSQSAFLHQVVKQLSSWHMLQHQVPANIQRHQGERSSLWDLKTEREKYIYINTNSIKL